MENILTFEKLPSEVANLRNEVKEIKALILQKQELQPAQENPININELSDLIGKTVPTIYGYCQRNEIPYNKKGNRLYFFKSQIIEWVKTGKQKTLKELQAEADAYLTNKKGLNYGK